MKPLVVGVVFVSAVGVLIWQAVASMIPVLHLQQLFAEEFQGGRVQVDNSEILSIENLAPLQFTVALKADPSTRLSVASTQTVPENFKPGTPVSIRGEYDKEAGVFHAYRITTQCPSRYEATEQAYNQKNAPTLKSRREYEKGDSAPVSRVDS